MFKHSSTYQIPGQTPAPVNHAATNTATPVQSTVAPTFATGANFAALNPETATHSAQIQTSPSRASSIDNQIFQELNQIAEEIERCRNLAC